MAASCRPNSSEIRLLRRICHPSKQMGQIRKEKPAVFLYVRVQTKLVP